MAIFLELSRLAITKMQRTRTLTKKTLLYFQNWFLFLFLNKLD